VVLAVPLLVTQGRAVIKSLDYSVIIAGCYQGRRATYCTDHGSGSRRLSAAIRPG